MTKKEKENLKKGLLFASPWIVGFSVFVFYPFIVSLYYSFCYYNVFEKPEWIGLTNYANLFRDRIFWISLFNTFYFAVFSIPISFVITLMLALLLNAKIKGQTFFRLIFYLPSLVPMVALAILWLWIFNGEFGILNYFMKNVFGIQNPPNWLAEEAFAKPAFILMGLWTVGQSVVIYLSGLQDVPTSLLEASEIDGASSLQKIWHVVLPIISPIIYFNIIMAIIGTFQIFAGPYIMTGGGPGKSTTFYTLYLYQKAFEDFSMGYASAMAWILFILIIVLTVLATKLSKSRVHYLGT